VTASFAEITIGWLAIGAVIVLDLIKNADAGMPPSFQVGHGADQPAGAEQKVRLGACGNGPCPHVNRANPVAASSAGMSDRITSYRS
jgi:hypothetical protein